jgi:FAD/FMN-containing dehydrogenase/Fe-S oxidoreductase
VSHERLEELSQALSREIAGDIRLDAASRKLYSTDASIYEIEPLGVVFPRTEDDLPAIMALAAEYVVPVLPRGSGSSLAGQSVGAALVVDCSRHLTQVLSIDAENHSAWVQPGVVLNDFNRVASRQGYKYGPDPASADRATFGGMLGNNSTGAHSILYGMSSDNLLALDAVLANGSQARLEGIGEAEAGRRAEGDTREAQLYAAALAVREQYGAEIKARWPRVWRRASGYSLNYLLPWAPSQPPMWSQHSDQAYPPIAPGQINLAPVLVGSEGTLALFRRAQVRIVPNPPHTVLGVLSYASVAAACDAAPELLKLNPSSVELIPQVMIRLARGVPAYANQLGFVKGDPAALLVVEFAGDSQSELDARLGQLGPEAVRARSSAEQEQIWSVRRVGLGLLMSRVGDAKPLPFIEDVAVPVEVLGDFVRGLERIFAEHGTSGDFYAHASAGCLHVRPLINLKTLEGIRQMRSITEAVVELASGFGGAMTGEHGDGLSHGEWLERVFGAELIAAHRMIKQAADPDNLLNPGKIVNPPPMDQNLRFGADYQTSAWIPVMDFEPQGGLAGAIEMCNGQGVCRKQDGVMCPSFQATQDEMHSTRGRANLLRGMISGRMPTGSDAEAAVYEALDLCLECKGCKAECSSAVDMAKLKYEFLHRYYQSHRRPLRDYLFANLDRLGRLARPLAPMVNVLLGSGAGRWLGERMLGLSAKRGLPAFKAAPKAANGQPGQPDVLFLRDAFTEFFYPEVIEAAFALLEAAGLRTAVLPVMGAGRASISKGFLPQAKRRARRLLAAVAAVDPDGQLPVVGVEPSELYTLRDEYLDLLPYDAGAAALAARSYMLEEFLLRPNDNDRRPIDAIKGQLASGGAVLLHGHCYQKAQPPAADGYPSGNAASAALLAELGLDVEQVASGCCGMAGSFGYEVEHFDLSMQIGELALFPAVRAAAPERSVLAAGVSCRTQIASGTERKAQHPIAYIADLLS